MITYQDYLKIGTDDKARIEFVREVIETHKRSDIYNDALVCESYFKRQNKTIIDYQKLLYTVSGEAVPDNFSANYKITSGFFQHFIIQQVQYLLGNGISWNNHDTEEKLGKNFVNQIQKVARNALVGAVSFGFWNYDHVDIFKITEYAPIPDEEDGSHKCGVRFWQIDKSKPLRATFYEMDGYTDYIWRDTGAEIFQPKRTYVQTQRRLPSGDTEIIDGYNYPTFPIVPLWANENKQSELVGLRSGIDAYDLIKSGFANDLDDASQIYWIVQNAGGMDDVDLAQFVRHMKTVKAAVVEDTGARAESHTMEVPYNAREAILDRLRADLFEDAMALDTKNISGGAVTATQIEAAYEPLNEKTDLFEYQVTDFIERILAVAGIDDTPTYTRSMLVNKNEEIGNILSSAQYLPEDYVTEKLLVLMGDIDRVDEILKMKDEESMERMPIGFGTEDEDGLRASGNGQGTEETGAEAESGV